MKPQFKTRPPGGDRSIQIQCGFAKDGDFGQRPEARSQTGCSWSGLIRSGVVTIMAALWCLSSQVVNGASAVTREQSIQLHAGWNSVFLEVEPLTHKPAELFAGTSVEVVAAFFPQTHPTTYIKNPGDAPWREEGWQVWYKPQREDGFLANLYAIHGNQAYLIYSSTGFTWNVRGGVNVRSIRWQPNSYNLTGFSVDRSSPPTFEKFFAASPAQRGQRVYRLVDGVWTPVRDLSTTAMKSGEAYWVYCSGGSSYQGPISFRMGSGEELSLGGVARDARVELVNASAKSALLVVEPIGTADSLPLSYVHQDLQNLRTSFPELPSRLELPVDGGSSQFLRLAARREKMTVARQSTLLRISDGAGVELWLPVVADRAQ